MKIQFLKSNVDFKKIVRHFSTEKIVVWIKLTLVTLMMNSSLKLTVNLKKKNYLKYSPIQV
jgi:hypothetical protein